MSGGHFDHNQWIIGEIADKIERDIALALKPKPEIVHEDYWTIYEQDSPDSYHSLLNYKKFQTLEEAEVFLKRYEIVEDIEPKHLEYCRFSEYDRLYQSALYYMRGFSRDKQIPKLYSIQHCVYDHYPYDKEIIEVKDETLETMKEAYRQIRIAEIYANRVDWMMSGDDSEESMQERLKEELDDFEEEFRNKDWTLAYDDSDD